MFCRQCGKQIEDQARFCPFCGAAAAPVVYATQKDRAKEAAEAAAAQAKSAAQAAYGKAKSAAGKFDFQKLKKVLLGAVCVLLVMAVCGSFMEPRCEYGSCRDEVLRGDYCAVHVCAYSGCTSSRSSGSAVCSYHARQIEQAEEAQAAQAEKNLVFSNIKITHNSSYTVVTGKVTNTGKRTYKFVQVKGSFKNSSGKVVDTDWTYAVGSEGLAPGESSEFRLSVSKDTSIKKCDITIIDYDVK